MQIKTIQREMEFEEGRFTPQASRKHEFIPFLNERRMGKIIDGHPHTNLRVVKAKQLRPVRRKIPRSNSLQELYSKAQRLGKSYSKPNLPCFQSCMLGPEEDDEEQVLDTQKALDRLIKFHYKN